MAGGPSRWKRQLTFRCEDAVRVSASDFEGLVAPYTIPTSTVGAELRSPESVHASSFYYRILYIELWRPRSILCDRTWPNYQSRIPHIVAKSMLRALVSATQWQVAGGSSLLTRWAAPIGQSVRFPRQGVRDMVMR